MPTGVRMVAGRALPPDVLRNRLSQDQQAAIGNFVARVETSGIAVQATFVATMLASEPAKWRTQLTRLAPLLGIELFKETQAQVARIARAGAGIAPAAAQRICSRCSTAWSPPIASACARSRARSRPPWRPATCCASR